MKIFIDADCLMPPTESGVPVLSRQNIELIEALRLLNGIHDIIVWSTLSAEYAEQVAEHCLMGHSVMYEEATSRALTIPGQGEIVVDDNPTLAYMTRVIHLSPAQFATCAAEWRKAHDEMKVDLGASG